MRGRAVLALSGVVVAGSASAAVLWSGAVRVPHTLLSQLPFGLGDNGAPTSVAAQAASVVPSGHEATKPVHIVPPFLPGNVSTLPPIAPPAPPAATPPNEPGPSPPPTGPSPPTPTQPVPPTPPSPSPPPVTPPPPSPPPSQPPPQPPQPPTTPPGGSTGSGSSSGSSGPPPPPPPPPPISCTISGGVLAILGSKVGASALVSGCSTTDLRLTLAAYRRSSTSFVLLASVTLHPVPDGPMSQVLEFPACSTDIVLIRGIASGTLTSFGSTLAHTAAPGCTPPPPPTGGGNGDQNQSGGGQSDRQTADAGGDTGAPADSGAGDQGGTDQPPSEPPPTQTPPHSGDAGEPPHSPPQQGSDAGQPPPPPPPTTTTHDGSSDSSKSNGGDEHSSTQDVPVTPPRDSSRVASRGKELRR